MFALDDTQPVVLCPTVPDIPLMLHRRTYRSRRRTPLLRLMAACPLALLILAPVVWTPLQAVITVLAIGMAALMFVTGVILLAWAVLP